MKASLFNYFSPFLVIIGTLLLPFGTAYAAVPATKYPRLANYYLNPTLTPSIADQLAKWDFLVLDMEAGYTTPELLQRIRAKNQDIVILAYVTSEEIAARRADIADHNNPSYQLFASIPDSWWLMDTSGNRASFWQGTNMLNVTNTAPIVNGDRWNTFLPKFLHEHILSTGLWDGIYYDNTWNNISWLNNGNLDLNQDGIAESKDALDAAWRDGMNTLLSTSRQLEGDSAILLGNGGGQYFSQLNGRLMEEFPNPEDGSWPSAMNTYLDIMKNARKPSFVILNGKSATQQADDFQSMRFALASTLLGDGLVSFDAGIALNHVQLWWYDSYSVYFGKPLGDATDILHDNGTQMRASVWRRDFRDGIVLLNSTDASRTIDLVDGYEQVSSALAATTRPNVIISKVTLAPKDGLLLLRRKFTVEQGAYINGSFARVFSAQGVTNRQGFFSYDPALVGSANVVKQDIDHDNRIETVYSQKATVTVLDDTGTTMGKFQPYGAQYRGTINLAVGDVNGDGTDDIVTGTSHGAGPQVRIFNLQGTRISGGFFAYERSSRSGVSVAVGDVNGDGKAEIVTGPGQGAGPQVRVFNRNGRELNAPFFAFEKSFRGGISVSIVDVDRDHRNEILVSTPTLH